MLTVIPYFDTEREGQEDRKTLKGIFAIKEKVVVKNKNSCKNSLPLSLKTDNRY